MAERRVTSGRASGSCKPLSRALRTLMAALSLNPVGKVVDDLYCKLYKSSSYLVQQKETPSGTKSQPKAICIRKTETLDPNSNAWFKAKFSLHLQKATNAYHPHNII